MAAGRAGSWVLAERKHTGLELQLEAAPNKGLGGDEKALGARERCTEISSGTCRVKAGRACV